VQDVSSCTTNLPIIGVTASGYQLGNPPPNAIDADLNTRWPNDGVGSWISADLGTAQNICSVDIALYNGFAHQYHFVIATSTDGITFTPLPMCLVVIVVVLQQVLKSISFLLPMQDM
jgi:hypothetical protein